MIKYDTKKVALYSFLIYAVANLLTYALSHVAYLLANDVLGAIFEYVSYYLTKSLEFVAPPIIATVCYIILASNGKRSAILSALAISSARVFYTLPYYYVTFVTGYAYDSIESLCLSAVASAFVIFLTLLGVFISIAIYAVILRITDKNKDKQYDLSESAFDTSSPTIDFLAKGNRAILVFALARFAFSLVKEIIDTVMFLIEFRADYRAGEIITMLASFILLFLLLIVSYLLSAKVKNILCAEKTNDEDIKEA